MIYVRIFSSEIKRDLEDMINEWLGAQRHAGQFLNIKSTHYDSAGFGDDVLYSCMIVYEMILSEDP